MFLILSNMINYSGRPTTEDFSSKVGRSVPNLLIRKRGAALNESLLWIRGQGIFTYHYKRPGLFPVKARVNEAQWFPIPPLVMQQGSPGLFLNPLLAESAWSTLCATRVLPIHRVFGR